MAITVSFLGLITAIAAPSVTKMVQDSRIKSTTNHILGSLQFARQTAAIEQKQVTVCSPAPGNSESCALSANWQSGIALLLGKARINSYTPPAPPASPIPTVAPSAPNHPGYPPAPVKPATPAKPAASTPPQKPVIEAPLAPTFVPVQIIPKPTIKSFGGLEYTCDSAATVGSCSKAPGAHLVMCSVSVYCECETTFGYYDGGRSYDTVPESWASRWYNTPLLGCDAELDEYNEQIAIENASYDDNMQKYLQSIIAAEAAQKINDSLQAAYELEQKNYFQKVRDIDETYQKDLQAHEDAYHKKLMAWENEKASIDSAHTQAVNDWQQQKTNIDNAHQQQVTLHQQQVAAHQSAWQKQLDDHAKAMQTYNEELAKAPEKVVVLEETKTLLAHNPFSVTVASELHGKTNGIVYDKERVKGHGRIHIEDKRGRGEHSRTVCINMLGNIQVVKGNETCP